jgi:hypothetical protein
MSVSKQIPDNIRRVSRCVGYSLWLDNEHDWFKLPVILRARLDIRQRATLAFMALKSLNRDDALETAKAVLGGGAGMPLPPFLDPMSESEFWAGIASPQELEAYCLASFQAMPVTRQAAFLEFIQGSKAA